MGEQKTDWTDIRGHILDAEREASELRYLINCLRESDTKIRALQALSDIDYHLRRARRAGGDKFL